MKLYRILNPYRILKAAIVPVLWFAPFALGLGTSIGFSVYHGMQAKQIADDFKESAVFEEIKEEEIEKLSNLEIAYNEAKEKHQAGQVSDKDFLVAQTQFNDQKTYVESDELVHGAMKMTGQWEGYCKNCNATYAWSTLGLSVSGLAGSIYAIYYPDMNWVYYMKETFDEKADDWNEAHEKRHSKNHQNRYSQRTREFGD